MKDSNTIELDDSDCRALSMMCKRSFFERVRAFASSDEEARAMEWALLSLRNELQRHGYCPR